MGLLGMGDLGAGESEMWARIARVTGTYSDVCNPSTNHRTVEDAWNAVTHWERRYNAAQEAAIRESDAKEKARLELDARTYKACMENASKQHQQFFDFAHQQRTEAATTTRTPTVDTGQANQANLAQAASLRQQAAAIFAHNPQQASSYEAQAAALEASAGVTPKPATQWEYSTPKSSRVIGAVSVQSGAATTSGGALQSLILARALQNSQQQADPRRSAADLLGPLAIDGDNRIVKYALYGTAVVASVAGVALIARMFRS